MRRFHQLLPSLAAVIVWCAPAAAGVLQVTTRNASGTPIWCRVVARDGANRPLYPDTSQNECYPHYGPIPYFVSDGQFDLSGAGFVSLTFSKGPEYSSQSVTVDVTGNPSLDVVLHRIADMPAAGWHSGDTHVHLSHNEPNPLETQDGVRIARAEGLQYVAVLEASDYFTGAPDPASTPDCFLYASMEYRSHVYGHMALPGLTALVTPFASGAPGDPPYPMNADMIAEAKARNGLVLYAHPVSHADFWNTSGWPMTGIARELPADAALGLVDGIELLSYSNLGPDAALETYYELLNAGAHLAAVAGTDAVLNRPRENPAGGYRTYARTGSPAFDHEDWLDAVRRCRTFVTSGPLITSLTVGGAGIGDTLQLPAGPAMLSGSASFASDANLLRFEVLWNGEIAFSKLLPYAQTGAAAFSFPIQESGWLAVRVRSVSRPDVHVVSIPFAHSSPIWVELGGPFRPLAASVTDLVDWNIDLGTLVRERGGFEAPSDSLRMEAVLANGHAALGAPFASPPGMTLLTSPANWESVKPHPTLEWAASDPDPGDLLEYRVRWTTTPTTLGSVAPTVTNETELLVQSTLEHGWTYYWNVETRDAARNVSFSPVQMFVVDTTGTAGVPDTPAPLQWTASPVPFGGEVIFHSPVAAASRVTIFDAAGRRLRVLEGIPPLVWDGRDAAGRESPSGIYFASPGSGRPIRVVRLR